MAVPHILTTGYVSSEDARHRLNPSIEPDDAEWKSVHEHFTNLTQNSNTSVNQILMDTFTRREAILFVWSDLPQIKKVQDSRTKLYHSILNNRYRGLEVTLATKLTMLYFGLPVEPCDPHSDEMDLDSDQYSAESHWGSPDEEEYSEIGPDNSLLIALTKALEEGDDDDDDYDATNNSMLQDQLEEDIRRSERGEEEDEEELDSDQETTRFSSPEAEMEARKGPKLQDVLEPVQLADHRDHRTLPPTHEDTWVPLWSHRGCVHFVPGHWGSFALAIRKLLSLPLTSDEDVVEFTLAVFDTSETGRIRITREIDDKLPLQSPSEAFRFVQEHHDNVAAEDSSVSWFVRLGADSTPLMWAPTPEQFKADVTKIGYPVFEGRDDPEKHVINWAWVAFPKFTGEYFRIQDWAANQYNLHLKTAIEVLLGIPLDGQSHKKAFRIYDRTPVEDGGHPQLQLENSGTTWAGTGAHSNLWNQLHPQNNSKSVWMLESVPIEDEAIPVIVPYCYPQFVPIITQSDASKMPEATRDLIDDVWSKSEVEAMAAVQYHTIPGPPGQAISYPDRITIDLVPNYHPTFLQRLEEDVDRCFFAPEKPPFVVRPLWKEKESLLFPSWIDNPDSDVEMPHLGGGRGVPYFHAAIMELCEKNRPEEYHSAADHVFLTPVLDDTDDQHADLDDANFIITPSTGDAEWYRIRSSMMHRSYKVEILRNTKKDWDSKIAKSNTWGPRVSVKRVFRDSLNHLFRDSLTEFSGSPARRASGAPQPRGSARKSMLHQLAEKALAKGHQRQQSTQLRLPMPIPQLGSKRKSSGLRFPQPSSQTKKRGSGLRFPIAAEPDEEPQEEAASQTQKPTTTPAPVQGSGEQSQRPSSKQRTPKTAAQKARDLKVMKRSIELWAAQHTAEETSRGIAEPLSQPQNEPRTPPDQTDPQDPPVQTRRQDPPPPLSQRREPPPPPPPGQSPTIPRRQGRRPNSDPTYVQNLLDRGVQPSIFDDPLSPRIPMGAPPIESILRSPGNAPIFNRGVLTPSEQARLQGLNYTQRNQLLSRTSVCPYKDCQFIYNASSPEDLEQHLQQNHRVLECPWCDTTLLAHSPREQRLEHIRDAHSDELATLMNPSRARRLSVVDRTASGLQPIVPDHSRVAPWVPRPLAQSQDTPRGNPPHSQHSSRGNPPRFLSYPLRWFEKTGPVPFLDPCIVCPFPGCPEPNLSALNSVQVYEHFEKHHGGAQNKCPFCELSFAGPTDSAPSNATQQRLEQVLHYDCHVYKLWDALQERQEQEINLSPNQSPRPHPRKRCPLFHKCGTVIQYMTDAQLVEHLRRSHQEDLRPPQEREYVTMPQLIEVFEGITGQKRAREEDLEPVTQSQGESSGAEAATTTATSGQEEPAAERRPTKRQRLQVPKRSANPVSSAAATDGGSLDTSARGRGQTKAPAKPSTKPTKGLDGAQQTQAKPTGKAQRRSASPDWYAELGPADPEFDPEGMYCSKCLRRVPKKLEQSEPPSIGPSHEDEIAYHINPNRCCRIRNGLGDASRLPNRSGWIPENRVHGKLSEIKKAFLKQYPTYKQTIYPTRQSTTPWRGDPNNENNAEWWNVPWPPYEGKPPFPGTWKAPREPVYTPSRNRRISKSPVDPAYRPPRDEQESEDDLQADVDDVGGLLKTQSESSPKRKRNERADEVRPTTEQDDSEPARKKPKTVVAKKTGKGKPPVRPRTIIKIVSRGSSSANTPVESEDELDTVPAPKTAKKGKAPAITVPSDSDSEDSDDEPDVIPPLNVKKPAKASKRAKTSASYTPAESEDPEAGPAPKTAKKPAKVKGRNTAESEQPEAVPKRGKPARAATREPSTQPSRASSRIRDRKERGASVMRN
ncbi:hypothetical protein B0T10DRAFT_584564 [Thelonectria olida]|uniref:C2H2-type domain-containing protein n=1 Tax=Thelonectria olida TaxID=1576542 RepID=A0A9P9AKG5_9HYPO|nr:hypothetical protein B0T10DRAFT_584564 [Thelonectria olida]